MDIYKDPDEQELVLRLGEGRTLKSRHFGSNLTSIDLISRDGSKTQTIAANLNSKEREALIDHLLNAPIENDNFIPGEFRIGDVVVVDDIAGKLFAVVIEQVFDNRYVPVRVIDALDNTGYTRADIEGWLPECVKKIDNLAETL